MNVSKILFLVVCGCCLFQLCCKDESPIVPPEPPVQNCLWDGTHPLTAIDSVECKKEFDALAGPPIMPTLGDVQSVKVVYEIATGRTYHVAASAFELHFDFCRAVLGYERSHAYFNEEQYGSSSMRMYYLGTVNYYRGAGVYALQFFADDRISAEGIRTLFTAVRKSCFYGDNFFFLPNSTLLQEKARELDDIPQINESILYAGQRFVPLNPSVAYGYLKKVAIDTLDRALFSRHDILVVNGLPIALPVIAGIITSVFQTPLSHINVLSHNRGTPNCTFRNAWEDSLFTALYGKLICYTVTPDTFFVREASFGEADSFWQQHEPQVPKTPEYDDTTGGLFNIDELSIPSTKFVGAKAANLGELSRLTRGTEKCPVPDGAFAIPFRYYREHMRNNGIDIELQRLLGDSLFLTDASCRAAALEKLRTMITEAPLDRAFITSVKAKCRERSLLTRTRFRSSTNVEDIEGFNGAGLYESHSADLASGKGVEKAIGEVFASLWTLRGFDEREYFKIDQNSCVMGVLVHRSFDDEQANGVAITANIYQPYVPAYTVNVQIQDISVVLPPDGFLSDQALIHTFRNDWVENPTIEYIAHSNVNFGDPVLSTAEMLVLARWLEAIKDHFYPTSGVLDYYKFAMDVEFKFAGPERKLVIKQARPYTID